MTGFRHTVWTAQGTNPAEIEAALRDMLIANQVQQGGHAPARALNMVCIAGKRSSDEVLARLRSVGRFLASRTILCAVDARRSKIDATAEISSDAPRPGELALLRETVILDVGKEHLGRLEPIVDPLVVTDLPTVLWSPEEEYEQAVTALLPLAQVVLLDSERDLEQSLRHACELLQSAYVVDLAWLRSVPWRERVAATFDPPQLRPDLSAISAVTVRHHPHSAVSGLLLVGWLASRLGWTLTPLRASNGELAGTATAGAQEIRVALKAAPEQEPRGLAGVTVETATGRWLSLERGRGGLQAHYRNARGDDRRWTVLGASRGESGILGEGIRQALLRDPTYGPAASAARRLVGKA
jgi:glucose-6-phosphate dehydrogenase assembly protein OpcA